MSRTSKQRYRPSCRYFNFVCQPAGKYALECNKPRNQFCRDDFCTATSYQPQAVVRRKGQQTLYEVTI